MLAWLSNHDLGVKPNKRRSSEKKMGCYSLHTKHFLANNNFGVLVVFNIMTFFVPFLAKQKVQIFVFCSATKKYCLTSVGKPRLSFQFCSSKTGLPDNTPCILSRLWKSPKSLILSALALLVILKGKGVFLTPSQLLQPISISLLNIHKLWGGVLQSEPKRP